MNPTGKGGAQTPEGWQDAFLDTYSKTANVSASCRIAGVSRVTAYAERERNPAFAGSWELAKDDARDVVRQEILRRAVSGWDEPVFGYTTQTLPDGTVVKGSGVVGYVRKYSDTLLTVLAKALMPNEYRERLHVTTEDSVDSDIYELEQQLRRRGIDPPRPPAPALPKASAQEGTGDTAPEGSAPDSI